MIARVACTMDTKYLYGGQTVCIVDPRSPYGGPKAVGIVDPRSPCSGSKVVRTSGAKDVIRQCRRLYIVVDVW